jgi:hypothetical protein
MQSILVINNMEESLSLPILLQPAPSARPTAMHTNSVKLLRLRKTQNDFNGPQ